MTRKVGTNPLLEKSLFLWQNIEKFRLVRSLAHATADVVVVNRDPLLTKTSL